MGRGIWLLLIDLLPRSVLDLAHRCGLLDITRILCDDAILATGPGDHSQSHGQHSENHRRKPGEHQSQQDQRGDPHRFRIAKQLPDHRISDLPPRRCSGHHQSGCNADEQCRDLRDQAVSDRQGSEDASGLCKGHIVLQDTDGESADDVDHRDDDTCDRIATNKLARSVHRTVEIGLFCQFLPSSTRLLTGEISSIQVGVDGHLSTGHSIQGESSRYLGNSRCSLGYHDELDHHQNHEDDEAHHHTGSGYELTEEQNDIPGSPGTLFPGAAEHQSSGGDVEGQSIQRCQQ